MCVCVQVQKLSKNEILMVNIGSLSSGGRVSAVKADLAKIVLTNPVCTEIGEKIALSRRIEKHWRLIFQCSVRSGLTLWLSVPLHDLHALVIVCVRVCIVRVHSTMY